MTAQQCSKVLIDLSGADLIHCENPPYSKARLLKLLPTRSPYPVAVGWCHKRVCRTVLVTTGEKVIGIPYGALLYSLEAENNPAVHDGLVGPQLED